MENILAEQSLHIESVEVKKAALVFRAINHPLRQQMLSLIHRNARMTVTDIYCKLRLEQSVVSQHLAILRKAGFVATQRGGKFIFTRSITKDWHRYSRSL